MIKNTLILTILLLTVNLINAQKITKLSDAHFLDRSQVEDGLPMSIRKYIHYDLYLKLKSDSVRNLKGEQQTNFYDLAFQSTAVDLKKGDYYYDSNDNYFKFYINKKGIIEGEALLKNYRKKTETEMIVSNGVLVKSTTKVGNDIYSKTQLLDSLFIAEQFGKTGNLVEKTVINLKLGGGQKNTIFTHYHKDGKISSHQDNIKKTFVSYHENGNLKRESDDKTNSLKFYNENGLAESNQYFLNGEKCYESYDNGIITKKDCSNGSVKKEYYYKDGVLDYYEVYDRTSKKINVYNSKGELLKKQPAMATEMPTMGY